MSALDYRTHIAFMDPLLHRALARRLTLINLVLLRQLQNRHDAAKLCVRPADLTTYAPNGPCKASW